MRRQLAAGKIRIGLWLLAAACLTLQFCVPPFIGLADNADFGKVAGHLALAPVDLGASNFIYFQPNYLHTVRNYWNSPYESSETFLAWTALQISGARGEGARFDIRWLGAVHAALWLAALALLLRQRRIAGVVAAILIFTDVCYVSYLNTFYMDAAAMSGFLILCASACWIAAVEEPSPGQIVACSLGALIYVTAKTQHAIWLLLPVVFLAGTGLRCKRALTRRLALGLAVVVFASGAYMLATADPTNRAQALFNKLFFQIGMAPDGAAVLREMGVREDELRYIGTHSYAPGTPAGDQTWAQNFYAHTGYPRLAAWYVRHPGRAIGLLWSTLAKDAQELRQNNLSNLRRQDASGTNLRTDRFAVWSNFRSALLRRWPWHMVLWYVLFLAGVATMVLGPRSGAERRLAWVAAGVALLGLGHFALAALADCLETGRHLLLFQACTDVTICFAVGYAAARIAALRNAR
jgi:hypothetical protein